MKVKYPRTFHWPSSPGITSDDKVCRDISCFANKDLVFTEKMDGENTSFTKDDFWARSLDSNFHPSRAYVKKLWGDIKHKIPNNYRICGENLFAAHSIRYNLLPSYFMVFSIWENDKCFNFEETLQICSELNLEHVPVNYIINKNKDELKSFIKQTADNLDIINTEGFVIRIKDSFLMKDFATSVVKWVRKNHVTTSDHWMNKQIETNKLKV